jgi:hypothetical protein
MSQAEQRNEELPRASALSWVLIAETFMKISRDILAVAAERGKQGHRLVQNNWDTNLDHKVIQMFQEALRFLCDGDISQVQPVIEKQINGETFTGCPDFYSLFKQFIIDYKFTDELKNEVAIQLLAYDELIFEKTGIRMKNHYAFWFPTFSPVLGDGGLFVYRIPDRTIEPLRAFMLWLKDNHVDIMNGEDVKYEAISRWKKLQDEYDMFEPVYTTLPLLTLSTRELADVAVTKFYHLKLLKGYEDHFKKEIGRYMKENNITDRLESPTGHGVKWKRGKSTKKYDEVRLAPHKAKFDKAKAAYDKAKAECQTEVIDNYHLERYYRKPQVLLN